MCSICGCSHRHDHAHHDHAHHGPAPHHHSEIVRIEQDILSENGRYADVNRATFDDAGVCALNLISSPGSGKTTLLVSTVEALASRVPAAVIEGDQETSIDADRIRATGVPAVQINTGRGCHLDAHMVGHAFEELSLERGSLLFIENVGNLVCPAGFDLGEARTVVILSVTEGDDKPLKYPDAFAASDLLVLSKVDLLPYLDFDVGKCIEHARAINPALEVLQVSARSGEGIPAWLDWLAGQAAAASGRAALQERRHA
jgi:hydrogenase nickel incorporation protein HypB